MHLIYSQSSGLPSFIHEICRTRLSHLTHLIRSGANFQLFKYTGFIVTWDLASKIRTDFPSAQAEENIWYWGVATSPKQPSITPDMIWDHWDLTRRQWSDLQNKNLENYIFFNPWIPRRSLEKVNRFFAQWPSSYSPRIFPTAKTVVELTALRSGCCPTQSCSCRSLTRIPTQFLADNI